MKYRNVRCNFMPSGMIITKKGASSVRFDENGNPIKRIGLMKILVFLILSCNYKETPMRQRS